MVDDQELGQFQNIVELHEESDEQAGYSLQFKKANALTNDEDIPCPVFLLETIDPFSGDNNIALTEEQFVEVAMIGLKNVRPPQGKEKKWNAALDELIKCLPQDD